MFVTAPCGEKSAAGGDPVVDPLSEAQPPGEKQKGDRRPQEGEAGYHLQDSVDSLVKGFSVSGAVQPFFQPVRVEAKTFRDPRLPEGDKLQQTKPIQPASGVYALGTERTPTIIKDRYLPTGEKSGSMLQDPGTSFGSDPFTEAGQAVVIPIAEQDPFTRDHIPGE